MSIISKEILNLKVNISYNHYKIKTLEEDIKAFDVDKKNYLNELKNIVVDRNYKDKCFTCEELINFSDEFCVRCGWLKCSWCKSCGCNFGNSRINGRYKYILNNNSEARILKESIEKIIVNKSSLESQQGVLRSDTKVYRRKLKEFVKFGAMK